MLPTMMQSELFKTTSTLRKAGRAAGALELLRDALRRGLLDAPGIDKAGRFIKNELAEKECLDVLILGQCTTTWLATALSAIGWGRNLALRIVEGGYDNVLQTLDDERLRACRRRLSFCSPGTHDCSRAKAPRKSALPTNWPSGKTCGAWPDSNCRRESFRLATTGSLPARSDSTFRQRLAVRWR